MDRPRAPPQAGYRRSAQVDGHGLVATTALPPDLDDADRLRRERAGTGQPHAVAAGHDRVAPDVADVAVDRFERKIKRGQ
jgi:hypothetical protein